MAKLKHKQAQTLAAAPTAAPALRGRLWGVMRSEVEGFAAAANFVNMISSERLEEVRTILASSATGAGHIAFKIVLPEYRPPQRYIGPQKKGDAIFDELRLVRAKPRGDAADTPTAASTAGTQMTQVPGGGLLLLRLGDQASASGVTFAQRAELVLMRMLNGSIRAQGGTCACFPTLRAEIVHSDSSQQIMMASILENLLYGIVPHEKIDSGDVEGYERFRDEAAAGEGEYIRRYLPSEEQLHALCKHVGISDALVGATHVPCWSSLHLKAVHAWAEPMDFCKLALARALLRAPDVIMLHHVGDGWDEKSMSTLVDLVGAFLRADPSLTDVTQAHLPVHVRRSKATLKAAPRTVLWSHRGGRLRAAIPTVRHDPVHEIVLESPSLAVIHELRVAKEEGSQAVVPPAPASPNPLQEISDRVQDAVKGMLPGSGALEA